MNILLGLTGSVAATLAPRIVIALQDLGTVEALVTRGSTHFFDPSALGVKVWTNADEWKTQKYVKDQKIIHIELRRWADVLVIAPCSADSLATLAGGRSSTLLASVARAWDLTKPIIIAPAMNTQMWTHPATAEHLVTLKRWYSKLTLVMPVARKLACGDEGLGALAPITTIADAVKAATA